MVLFIDTTDFNQACLALEDSSGRIIKRSCFESGRKLSEKLLFEIVRLVQEAGGKKQVVKSRGRKRRSKKLRINDLEQIRVAPGPGSFTSTRIGVTVGNALGFALGVPVNQSLVAAPNYDEA